MAGLAVVLLIFFLPYMMFWAFLLAVGTPQFNKAYRGKPFLEFFSNHCKFVFLMFAHILPLMVLYDKVTDDWTLRDAMGNRMNDFFPEIEFTMPGDESSWN